MGAQCGDTHYSSALPKKEKIRLLKNNIFESKADVRTVSSEPYVLAPKHWRKNALDIIHKISHEVLDQNSLIPILQEITDSIISTFPISYTAIETYKNNKTVLSISSQSQTFKNQLDLDDPNQCSLFKTLAGETLLRDSTLIFSDANRNEYLICPSNRTPIKICHYIGVPLIIDGITSGVLSIATTENIVVNKETLAWSETIAHHISALLTRDVVQSRLKSNENVAINMLNALTAPTVTCSKDGTILNFNPAFRIMVEEFHDQILEAGPSNILELFNNETKTNSYIKEFRRIFKSQFKNKISHTRQDMLLTKSNFHRWYLATASLMPENETAIIMFVDITDRKHAQEMLEYEMLHDQSTGLPNRILFHERLNNSLAYNRSTDKSTSVFAIDINRYAFIIESLGHSAADQVILKVAKRIEKLIHPSDIIARVGSSEFALLVERIKDSEQARIFTHQIIKLFDEPFEIQNQEIYLAPSIGITLTNANSKSDADIVLHDAHAAMTQARDSPDLLYSFSSVSQSSQAYKKLNRERELIEAIAQNQFRVLYQPQVDLLTNTVVGIEALVRWNHPRYGLQSPNTFIGLAEETGLIDSLFEIVFTNVCKDIELLYDNGRNIPIWTNLSARQLADTSSLETIKQVLGLTKIPREMIGFELTETALMENPKNAKSTLEVLSSLGTSIALDDFGTGYSSLAYLADFPVNMIKIDKTFINELGSSQTSKEIVSAIIGLAHGLRLHALAEGVEKATQIAFLRELGCDRAQGYFYSHPVGIEELL